MLTKYSLIIQKITRWIQYLVNTVIFSLVAIIVILTLLSHLSIFGLKAFSVYSGSMKPSILPGDIILVQKVPVWLLGSRDVISFVDPTNPENTMTRRILAHHYQDGKAIFYTQGDANDEVDKWKVPESAIAGKMLFRLPKLGYLVDIVKKPQGYLFFILIPGIYILLHEGINLYHYIRQFGQSRSYYDKDYDTPAFT